MGELRGIDGLDVDHMTVQATAVHFSDGRTMKKLMIAVLAVTGVALAGAPVAGADVSAFIEDTDRIIVMHTADDPDGHWEGYPSVPAHRRAVVPVLSPVEPAIA